MNYENLSNNYQIYKEIFQYKYNILTLPRKENYIKNKGKKLEIANCSSILTGDDYNAFNNFINDNALDEKLIFTSIYGYVMSKYSGEETIYTSIINEEGLIVHKNLMENSFINFKPIVIQYDNDKTLINICEDINKILNIYEKNKYDSFYDISNHLNLLNVNNGIIFNDINKEILKSVTRDLLNDNMNIIFRIIYNHGSYSFMISYNKNLFDEYLIQNILESFIEVIRNTSNFFKNLKNIKYIPSTELDKILNKFNDNKFVYGNNQLYHTEFSNISNLFKNKSALIFEKRIFTFKELNNMSNSLAYFLRNKGVKRNEVIPIICERSYYFVIAAIGVMKAGGACLFIDPEFPKDRIQFMIDEVKAKIVLEFIPSIKCKNNTLYDNSSIFSYSLDKHDYEKNQANLNNINQSSDLSCLFFTSGTTGKPKGTLISHDNLINTCIYALTDNGVKDIYKFDNIIAFSKLTFVMSISEIFYPLLKGKTVTLCNNDEYNNPNLIGDIIRNHNVDAILCPPTRIKSYLNNKSFKDSLTNIKTFIFGGEGATNKFLQNFIEYSNATILYGYGQTESTAVCTVAVMNRNDILSNKSVTIGKPICNFEVYILDKNLKPVPVGVEGEIFIGGYSVSQGYLNQEELTSKKFIEYPSIIDVDGKKKGKKLYRTGDLGRWTNNGQILHLGRIDFQVKIRGQRVELSEIENIVKEFKGVDYSVVIDKTKGNGDKYLAGYYVTKYPKEVNNYSIHEFLKQKLPLYMIPKYFIPIDKIPVTANGKLDRRALPEPSIEELMKVDYEPPETEIEKILCHIFSDVFHINESYIGKNSNFFELGGDSINAIKISFEIERKLNIKLKVSEIINLSKINLMSKNIEEKIRNNKNTSNNDLIKSRHNKKFKATSQQLGIYLESIKNPNSIMYNLPFSLKLKKNIDIEKIKDGLNEIFKHQDILRTKYLENENSDGKNEIYGYIDDECVLLFEDYTYKNAKDFIRPFDLSKAPLIRVGFIKDEVLLIDIQHIISDGITVSIIINELNNYYYHGEVKKLDVQFSDFAIDLNEKIKSNFFNKQIEFYKNMFECPYEILNIPNKNRTNSENIMKYQNSEINLKKCSQIIDVNTSHKINQFIRNNGLSKTAFFLSIYGYVLSKYSGQTTIYSSVVVNNRNNHYIEDIIGMFASTQPILLKYDNIKDISFLDIIKENSNILMNIYNNQNLSFSELSQLLKLKNVNNAFVFQPKTIFQTKFIKNNIFMENENQDVFLNNETQNELNRNNISKFDIAMNILEKNDSYLLIIDYNNNKYDSRIISNILNSFIEVVKNFQQFNKKPMDIEYIPEQEKIRILQTFNINKYDYDINNKIYHVEFSKIAKQNPDKCAIVFDKIEINYQTLDKMTNSLAYYLRNNQKLGKGDIIPIISKRSYYYIIAAIAMMKSGASFLPIDPDLPLDRIKYILEEVNAKCVLYYDKKNFFYNNLKTINKENINFYYLENHDFELYTKEIENINKGNDLCYTIFTSGTTGKPKGTLISHKNLLNYCLYSQTFQGKKEFYDDDRFNHILAFSKLAFDMSISEIFYPLLKCKKVILCNEIEYNNPELLGDIISKNNVDFIFSTPSRINNYLNNERFKKSLKNVKTLIFGGENVPLEFLKNIISITDADVYVGYGPTESTAMCTITKPINEDIKSGEKINIGKPTCNYEIYILDHYLKPVPIGIEGNIYISGAGVGKGYLNRDELTKEKFVDCPFNNSLLNLDINKKKMYKSGDTGKWTEDGNIEFIGRTDFQVKINGNRIELSEIENIMKEIPGIEYCIVTDKLKDNFNKYLVGYYIVNSFHFNKKNIDSEIIVDGKFIRNYLETKLPNYMIPRYFIKINDIPLTSNGKLDKNQLPEPTIDDIILDDYIAPENDIEKILCNIYGDIFAIDNVKIGRNSNFYELGGDSLIAINVSSKINKELNIKLNIKYILSHPIIKDLAKFIEQSINKIDNISNEEKDIIKQHHKKEFPVTSQQLGVFLDSIKKSGSISYNIPMAYKLKKDIDIKKIKKAFYQIFTNYEILRSYYHENMINDKIEIYGYIDDKCTLKFEDYTYENVNQFIRPFNLAKAPLIRIGFIGNEILLIDIHHIISDGTTTTIIEKELNRYYYKNDLIIPNIQFSDYSIHINEKKKNGKFKKQIEFYKNMFDIKYDLLNIPKTENNINIQYKNGHKSKNENNVLINTSSREIDESTSILINEYVKKNQISKTALFITIYGLVLNKYSGQEIIYTSIISANRTKTYTENMIGMLVSTLPILLKFNNEKCSFNDIIKQNMNILMDIYNNQDISFSELSSILKLLKVNNTFVYQPRSILNNTHEEEKTIFKNKNQEIFLSKDNKNNGYASKFDITFNVTENEENYYISIDYNTNNYDSIEINHILDSYIEVLRNINNFNNNIYNIDYIPKHEKERIINTFNYNHYEYNLNKLYHQEFSKAAKKYPNNCAIAFEDKEISYKKLDEMSNSLAHYLREKLSIKRGDIIPIISERSYYFIIGSLAVMKCGGAYLSIDPEFPEDRIKYMIKEVNTKLILKYVVDDENNKKLNIENITQYSLKNHDYSINTSEIENINSSDDICYVLYTSGTTGKPKGTLITHNNLVNYCIYSQTYKGVEDIYGKDLDSTLAISKFTFDMTIAEINYSLLRGSKVVLCNDNEFNDPILLSSLITKHQVKYIVSVPSRFENYLSSEEFLRSLKLVKWILFGGEKLNINTLEVILEKTNITIYNGYGPTEATAMCSLNKITNVEEIQNNKNIISLIGKPLCNCMVYILDKNLKPVPVNVEGEIFIGGYGVGKGYLNHPELTNEKFLECPYYSINKLPGKMYRTGDLGMWTENGNIIYLGRIDCQVKIRGQRIELPEIENTIKEIDGIVDSVVIDKIKENSGDKYLVSYYISEKDINGEEIREFLKTQLPNYMIPSYFTRIYNLPITNNGKLDKNALPEPDFDEIIKEKYIAPETEYEKYICYIFSKVLNINEDDVGRTNDFYSIGGDSLNAIRVVSEIKNKYHINIKIKDIMNHSKVSDLASFIENIKNKNDSKYKIKFLQKKGMKEYPYPSDNRVYYLFRYINSTQYLEIIDPTIDMKRLEKAFNILLERHKVLKSLFVEKYDSDGKMKYYGIIQDKVNLKFEQYSIENFNEFVRPFDVANELVIRVGVINNKILMIDTNHAATDGYSAGILNRELFKIYNNEPLEELPYEFSDYSIYYNEQLKSDNFTTQINFYKTLFNEKYDTIHLPQIQYNENEEIKGGLNVYIVNTDSETWNIVNYIIKKYNLSKTAFFFTMYCLVMSIYSGQENIFTELVNSNRTMIHTDKLIGKFTISLPVLIKIKNKKLIDLIKEIMEIVLTIVSYDISFSSIATELNLPYCNSQFKFDPYDKTNEGNKYVKMITHDDVYRIFNREDLIYTGDIPLPSNTKDFAEFQFFLTEMKRSYEIVFIYNKGLYEENLLKSMIESFIYLIKNESCLELTIKDITALCLNKCDIKPYSINENLCNIEQLKPNLLQNERSVLNKNNTLNNHVHNNNEIKKNNHKKHKKNLFKKLIKKLKIIFL